MENPPKKFFRLAPGREVRLRYAYFITCREVVKNAAGDGSRTALHLRSGDPRRQRAGRPQGAGDAALGVGKAFACRPRCGSTIRCSRAPIRTPAISPPTSIRIRWNSSPTRASSPPCPAETRATQCSSSARAISASTADSTPERLVFNRTVGLRDTWAKVAGSGGLVLPRRPAGPRKLIIMVRPISRRWL